ncbi:MAG: Rid family detoxifying hydrolase [Eubacteriales bacterium]|nr:Rid family detoxifying hydrolase [Eubacteriales bacterium]
MQKLAINSDKAPDAVGPYSHCTEAGGFVFVSGQMPVKDGKIETEDIAQATRNCMQNIQYILEAAGSDLSKALKITIYLTDMNDFAEVNKAYGEFFDGDYPARVCCEVSGLPKNVNVEIDCIALK